MIRRLCLVVALFTALLGPQTSQAQGEPYEINVVTSTTGGLAFLGKAELDVFKAIEDLTNHSGGIRGRPVKFTVLDDQTNAQNAVQLVNGLIAKPVSVILGPGSTATCLAVLPLIANGPVSYCFSPAVHPPTGSFMFSASPSSDEFTTELIRYCRGRGWTRLALIAATDATGQDMSRTFDEELAKPENSGIRIVVREQFNPTDISVSAQMAHIKTSDAQLVLTTATGSSFGTLLHGIRDAGLELPVFSNGGNMTFAQMEQYRAILPRELLFLAVRGVAMEPQAPPAVAAAQRAYFSAFNALGVHPGVGQVLAWDATMIVVDALKRLGPSATSVQLRDAIANMKTWTGICGPYDFQKYPQRGLGLEATIIYRWDDVADAFVVVSKPAGAPPT